MLNAFILLFQTRCVKTIYTFVLVSFPYTNALRGALLVSVLKCIGFPHPPVLCVRVCVFADQLRDAVEIDSMR